MSGKLKVWPILFFSVAGLGLLAAGFAAAPHVPHPVSATGDANTLIVSWGLVSKILELAGLGSFVAPVTLLLSRAQWFYDLFHKAVPSVNADPNATPVAPGPAPAPVDVPDLLADSEELALATVAYLKNRGDKFALSRFLSAVTRELYDVLTEKYPALAKPFNDLLTSITAVLFPSNKEAAQ